MIEVKGYWNATSYMGFVNGFYMEFESDTAYKEYLEEEKEDKE